MNHELTKAQQTVIAQMKPDYLYNTVELNAHPVTIKALLDKGLIQRQRQNGIPVYGLPVEDTGPAPEPPKPGSVSPLPPKPTTAIHPVCPVCGGRSFRELDNGAIQCRRELPQTCRHIYQWLEN